MISFETAKALKNEGLIWKPQMYDLFEINKGIEMVETLFLYNGNIENVNAHEWNKDKFIWYPRLEQMMVEIQRREYVIDLLSPNDMLGEWRIILRGGVSDPHFYAKSPEEATAKALLWLLHTEVKE